MREPDFQLDGWCLEDGEAYHQAAPDTFSIPPRSVREGLRIGDLAKLIFRIRIDNPDEPEAIERMWVVIRERTPTGYLGMLDNDPVSIEENDELWSGTELPFAAHHVIEVEIRDEASIALASRPGRPWPED